MSTSSQSLKKQSGSELDRKLPYINKIDGFRDVTAPPYQYQHLSPENEEIRILVLQPCSGDKNDPYNYVKCTFDVQSLANADSLIAVKNARGYRLLQEVIEINDGSLLISTALEKFLRHLRNPDAPIRLWVRYICVDQTNPEEMSSYWTRDFVDKVYEKAQSVMDMQAFLNDLLRRGVIEKVVDSRYEEWDKNWDFAPEEALLPKVYPIKLGKKLSNEHPTDDYEYLPLDAVADEVRIIAIPANPDAEASLVLHLAHCPIGSEVAYHALSYTWGSTPNARRLCPTHGLAIWADGICINQCDVDEKNRQIPRIANLWDKAIGVVCYVGDPDVHSDLALDFVKHLQGPVVRMDDDGQFMVGEPERISPKDLPRYCAALYLFLMRPYFRRVWVLQEVALASNPVIACGKRFDVGFEELDSAAYNLQDMLSCSSELPEKMKQAIPQLQEVSAEQLLFVRKLFYFRHLHIGRVRNGFVAVDIKDKAPGYLETAILSRDFQATVPHDKLFALWNIARDKEGLEFQMDYSKTYEETFVDFAKAWSLHSGSLDICGAAEYMRPASQNTFYATGPSWCPDWTRPSQSSSLIRREVFRKFKMAYQDDTDGPIYSSDGGMRQKRGDYKYFHFAENVLHCLGVILDTIFVAAIINPANSIESKIDGLVPYTEEFCAKHNLTAYEDVAQAVVAMLHGDIPTSWPKREDNLENASEDYPDETYICIPYKPRLNQKQTPHASRHVPTFAESYSRQEAWEAVCTVMRGRKAFITERGYVGLMPEYVEAKVSGERVDSGLRLAILATCSVPVLLREDPAGEGTYTLLGTCFVQGWMEGEILMKQMGCERPEEFWEAMVGSEKLKIV